MPPSILACNYLIEAEELLGEGKIQFDYFKFPSYGLEPGVGAHNGFYRLLEEIVQIKPVLYHGIYPNLTNLCDPLFQENFDLAAFEYVCKLTHTPGISLHFDGAGSQMNRGAVIATAIDGLIFLEEHLPEMAFITIENTEHAVNPSVYEPAVIGEIIYKTGTGLLLDISHANWAAQARGESLKDYINQLPLDRLVELQLNGWINHAGEQIAHLKIQEELFPLIEDLIVNSPVQIITLEYGRSLAVPGIDIPLVNYRKSNPRVKLELIEQLNKLSEFM